MPNNMPDYLYHATGEDNARSIAKNGLQARSVGGQDEAYLSMSGTLKGATTLEARANDIIFRVAGSSLNADSWSKKGASKEEWRSTEGIAAGSLQYRRYLGNQTQTTWRKARDYPLGMDGKG